jgi:hypothetical protein
MTHRATVEQSTRLRRRKTGLAQRSSVTGCPVSRIRCGSNGGAGSATDWVERSSLDEGRGCSSARGWLGLWIQFFGQAERRGSAGAQGSRRQGSPWQGSVARRQEVGIERRSSNRLFNLYSLFARCRARQCSASQITIVTHSLRLTLRVLRALRVKFCSRMKHTQEDGHPRTRVRRIQRLCVLCVSCPS